MDYLPTDPAILVSSVNMLLRDEEFDSLESLCYAFSCEPAELRGYLLLQGFVYSLQQKQFRPIGYDDEAVQSSVSTPVTRDSVETAYSFLHQKRNVYVHSTLDWQRDDIEYAIGNFADDIHPLLLDVLADGRSDFLHDHRRFLSDITQAVERLATFSGTYGTKHSQRHSRWQEDAKVRDRRGYSADVAYLKARLLSGDSITSQ